LLVIDEGHEYVMHEVGDTGVQRIKFVKQSSGAVTWPDEHGGLNCQEVMRILIHRTKVLEAVLPCAETHSAIGHLKAALYQFELRAWRRKQQGLNKKQPVHREVGEPPFKPHLIEYYPTCSVCGHIFCEKCKGP